MTTFADQFQNFTDLQKQGFEPFRDFTVFAVDTLEKVARQNYALYGDMLNFAVEQSKLPISTDEPKDLFEQQVKSTKAFATLLNDRIVEYAELGKEIKNTSATLFEKDIIEPAKKAAKAAQKAAQKAA